jgi:pimeloyl-ACP methyl ester carboxylesterase
MAGDMAFRIFCAPELSQYRPANHRQLAARARFHLRDARWERIPTPIADIQTYTFEPDCDGPIGTILGIHGWTGEASFMTAIAEPIRRAGFRVVLLDLPAHGLSGGNATNMIDCASATALIGKHFGPLCGIVAHSFGGMISLVAAEGHPPMPHRLEVPRIVLIASPDRLSRVTSDFSRYWGLSAGGQRAFEHRLERVGGRSLDCFTIVKLLRAAGSRALVIHDRDDVDVAFECAEEITTEAASAELRAFSGLGHRSVLAAPPVMRTIVSYLAGGDK